MQPAPLVTYIRVSTSGQSRSGLGINAQRHTLAQFAKTEGFEIAREFVEVEKGLGCTGPPPSAQGCSGCRSENSDAMSRSPSSTA